MLENDIKSLFKKYKLISTGALFAFLMLAIYLNQFLINNAIERHYELGLPYTTPESGFMWGAIIIGLFTVLQLCFYSFEKILLKLLIKPKAIAE